MIRHMWLLLTSDNVTSASEKLNIKLYLIFININLDVNSYKLSMAIDLKTYGQDFVD